LGAGSIIDDVTNKINSKALLELTYELVKIESPTLHEEDICSFYHDLLETIGLSVSYQVVEGSRKNVIAMLKGKGGGKNLLIGGHLDTISPETCVNPKLEEDKVYGRGAQDMKGSMVCMAIAARALIDTGIKLRGDLTLAGWIGHEAPHGKGEGPRAVAEAVKEGKIRADSVIVAEGSMINTVGIAQGGMAIFTITLKGKAGSLHTTLVPLRSNPILWSSRIIEELFTIDIELNEKPPSSLIHQRPSVQIGIIKGGDFYNRLPRECKIIGTIRWNPDESFSDAKKTLLERLKKTKYKIQHCLDSSVDIEVDLQLVRESYKIDENEEIINLAVKAVSEIIKDKTKLYGSRSVGDPSIFAKVAEVPTISLGLSASGKQSSHSNLEWIDGDRLEKLSKILATLIILYCGAEEGELK
jgi:acetylornithine deacetylase